MRVVRAWQKLLLLTAKRCSGSPFLMSKSSLLTFSPSSQHTPDLLVQLVELILLLLVAQLHGATFVVMMSMVWFRFSSLNQSAGTHGAVMAWTFVSSVHMIHGKKFVGWFLYGNQVYRPRLSVPAGVKFRFWSLAAGLRYQLLLLMAKWCSTSTLLSSLFTFFPSTSLHFLWISQSLLAQHIPDLLVELVMARLSGAVVMLVFHSNPAGVAPDKMLLLLTVQLPARFFPGMLFLLLQMKMMF